MLQFGRRKTTGLMEDAQPKKSLLQEAFDDEFKVNGKFGDFLDLKTGVDYRATIEEINAKKGMNGANAWMLICSIMIASIGLNLNSQAVIIGAMLISPLMSPILGLGLSVGINDRAMLLKSLMHFVAAMLIAIVTSTLYFYFTPLSDYTEQIQARTEPTFLDILVAIFGGVAGIVSIVRKDISTTLPGVAIATALMPPLCVTGYGIAEGSLLIASKSFYLFFLNSFFVAFATFIIIRYLQFPYKQYMNKAERRRNLIYITVFSLAMIIPSFFIFREVLGKVRQKFAINTLIEKGFGDDKIFLDNHVIYEKDGQKQLILKVYGDAITDDDLPRFSKLLDQTVLKGIKIDIIPTSEINLDQIQTLQQQITEVGSLTEQLTEVQKEKIEKEQVIQELTASLQDANIDSTKFMQLGKEVKILFKDVEQFEYAKCQKTDFTNYTGNVPSFLVSWKGHVPASEKQKLDEFLHARAELDSLRVIHY